MDTIPVVRTLSLAAALFAAAPALAADPPPAQKAKPPAPAKAAATKNPVVVIETSMGTIKAEIFADKAPLSAANFMKYVDDKFYDGTIFHRVIDGFMIQGGGFDQNFEKKNTRDPIQNEASNGLKNATGTLAMARTSDPNSATAQFYINTVDNVALDFRDPSPQGIGYAVFGKVIDGMNVAMEIGKTKTGTAKNGMPNAPVTAVVIKSVRRAK